MALYFACEEYGDVCYKGIENEEDTKRQEANGVIFLIKNTLYLQMDKYKSYILFISDRFIK